MKNIQEFGIDVWKGLLREIGAEYQIILQPVLKNNSVKLLCLCVKNVKSNMGVDIYLEEYYEDYKRGREITDIIKKIAEDCEVQCPKKEIEFSYFLTWSNVKNRVMYKLVNYEMNRKLLKNVPHVKYLDLAIVFYYSLETDGNGTATIQINNYHMRLWKIGIDELLNMAKENTPKLLGALVEPLDKIVEDLLCVGEIMMEDMLPPMYIMTNNTKLMGAATMLYPEALKTFAEEKKCDFHILPSSIHEILLIPADGSCDEEWDEIIKVVNDTVLDKCEVLSDHAYYYSRATNEVTM